jgi:hypothetical protein
MREKRTWRDLPAESADDLQNLDGFSYIPPATGSQVSIPVALYYDILHLLCTITEERRFWSICAAVLHDACKRLDPHCLGVQLSIVQYMPPVNGNIVRCLQERAALGTPPWSEQLGRSGRFFGAESLVGSATVPCRRQVFVDVGKAHCPPDHLPEHAMSAAASPIVYAGRAAGCLLAVSTQPDFFSQTAQLDLILNYAQLLTLAFRPEDYYQRERIDLSTLPSLQEQQAAISTLPQRIVELVKKAVLQRSPISYDVAEQHALWQIEAELLQSSPPPAG